MGLTTKLIPHLLLISSDQLYIFGRHYMQMRSLCLTCANSGWFNTCSVASNDNGTTIRAISMDLHLHWCCTEQHLKAVISFLALPNEIASSQAGTQPTYFSHMLIFVFFFASLVFELWYLHLSRCTPTFWHRRNCFWIFQVGWVFNRYWPCNFGQEDMKDQEVTSSISHLFTYTYILYNSYLVAYLILFLGAQYSVQLLNW